MRLLNKEIEIIKEISKSVFGEVIIYVFGSRLDDFKSGGDIDLYIIPKLKDGLFKKKMRLKTILEDILYKPVDIVIARDKKRLIEQEALRGVIL